MFSFHNSARIRYNKKVSDPVRRRIFIDVRGSSCPTKGSEEFLATLKGAVREAGLEADVEVLPRGCFGLCTLAPNLYIEPDGIWYSRFTLKDVPVIVREHLVKGKPVTRLIHHPSKGTVPNTKGGCEVPETLIAKEVEVGDMAPDFTLKDQDGNMVTLSSFRGTQSVVLAFYPFDWSPVCTTENCAISNDLKQFEGKGSVIFGVSCDSHFSHKAWREKEGYKHSLLSDQKREVAKKYGLYIEDFNCSKRATVVVDKSGKVIYKKVQEIKVPRSNQEILGAIR